MKYFFFLCAALLALGGIFSCRTSQPTEPARDYSRSEGSPYTPSHLTQRTDTPRVVVQPHKSVLDKVLHREPKWEIYTLPPDGTIKAGKKATITINHVAGDQQNNTAAKNAAAGTGATSAAKADAPVATGGATATDQAHAQASSTIKGDNNTPTLTNTAPEAPGMGATIAGAIATPVGKVVAALLVVLVCFGVYKFWPVLRRKDSTNTTA